MLLLTLLLAIGAARAGQPEGAAPPTTDTTAASQAFIKHTFDNLVATMRRTAIRLEKTDPHTAEVLKKAADMATAAGISGDMQKVIDLLGQGQTAGADQNLTEVVEQLQALRKLLLGETPEDVLPIIERRRAEVVALIRRTMAAAVKTDPAGAAAPRSGADRDKDAGEQNGIADDTAHLGRKFVQKDDKFPNGLPDGDKLTSAAGHGHKAAGHISNGRPGDAHGEQKLAIEDLQKVLEGLDNLIASLGGAHVDQTLTSILEKLQDMLARQKVATVATRNLDDKRAPGLRWPAPKSSPSVMSRATRARSPTTATPSSRRSRTTTRPSSSRRS